MNKKRVLSIAASAILAGSVFVGCSWNDDDAAPAVVTSTTINAPQDGLIVQMPTGGLQLSFDNGTKICTSSSDLVVASGKYSLNANSFVCNTGTINFAESYKLVVKPGAIVDTDGDGAYNATNDTKPLEIEIKAKNTDAYPSVLTTLREVATEQGNTALAASLANVGAESPVALLASKPQLYATSQMVVKAIKAAAAAGNKTVAAAASDIGNALTGIATMNLTSNTAPTITTGANANANVIAFANTNAITALTAVVKEKVGTSVDATKMAALTTNIEASNQTIAQLQTALSVTLSGDAATAAAAAAAAINTANTAINTYDNAAKLTVNSISMKVGSVNYPATGNNFSITKPVSHTVSASDDVVISLAAFADNLTVTNGTLKAKIAKGDNQYLTITISGVSITSTNGKPTATIAKNAVVSIDTVGIAMDDMSGTLDNALTVSDLSFSLNTLANAITSSSGSIAAAKANIIAYINKAGTYTLTVGISGLASGTITNLSDTTSALGISSKGVAGTVTVNATASSSSSVASSSSSSVASSSSSVASSSSSSVASSSSSVASSSSSSVASSSSSSAASNYTCEYSVDMEGFYMIDSVGGYQEYPIGSGDPVSCIK